ncbi:hypothetical protein DAI22_06g094900 [Oryza sativa Japonica Group]|nr:hypothetical protein DAI22_06g094900 [Oryza sativa Japonica Group]
MAILRMMFRNKTKWNYKVQLHPVHIGAEQVQLMASKVSKFFSASAVCQLICRLVEILLRSLLPSLFFM